VETALVLPVILLLLFGIIEFGRILNTYIMLTNASREGARYSIVGHSEPEVKQAVVDKVQPIIPTFTAENVRVDGPGGVDDPNRDVTVTAKYDLPLITPVVRNLVSSDGTFKIKSSTVMRTEK